MIIERHLWAEQRDRGIGALDCDDYLDTSGISFVLSDYSGVL